MKPSGGGGGAGIIKLTCVGEEVYRVHAGSTKRVIQGKEQTVAYLRSLFRPKIYLLQPHLSLGRISGRPFDIRVMVQRPNHTAPWMITGWLAKLAGPGYVVTNVARSRGKVLPLRKAITESKIDCSPHLLQELRQVSFAIARRLGRVYPNLREIGLDLGLDEQGKIWFIEANFRPAISLFQKLPDKGDYHKIKALRARATR